MPPLLESGHRVVIFDQPFHGESTGSFWLITTTIKTIETLARGYAPLAGIIGFSVGGTIAAYTLWKNKISCPKLVLMNPPMQILTVLEAFVRRAGIDDRVLGRVVEVASDRGLILPEHMREELDQYADGLFKDRGVQVMMTRDGNDKIALPEGQEWLRKKLGVKEILSTDGLGHFGCLESKDVISIVVEYVAGRKGDSIVIAKSEKL